MLKFEVLGEQWSGKTTAAEAIQRHFFNPQVVKFADPIYWALAALGQPKNRGFMQEFGDLAQRYFGERIFANLFMQGVTEEGRFVDALICDDVRRGYELDSCLDLGSCQVLSFTRVDLERLLQVDINRVFYEWAVTEIGPLDEYWYIVLTRTVKRTDLDHIPIDLFDIYKVAPTVTRFPVLSRALLSLVCFPWQADVWRWEPKVNQEAWHGFQVPFLIVIDADLLKVPASRPPIEQLDREPAFDPSTGEMMDFDLPTIWTSLDQEETRECEEIVRSIASELPQFGSQAEWQFF